MLLFFHSCIINEHLLRIFTRHDTRPWEDRDEQRDLVLAEEVRCQVKEEVR